MDHVSPAGTILSVAGYLPIHSENYGVMPHLVRKELMKVSAILPLLRVCLTSQWDPRVHASDASSSGLSVYSRLLDVDSVAKIGRVSEK